MLPANLPPDVLQRFLSDYRISYAMINRNDRYQRRNLANLQALAARGVQCRDVLDYVVCDTRVLSGAVVSGERSAG